MKHIFMLVIVASLLSASSLPAGAQQGPANVKESLQTSPGKATISRSQQIAATVEAIDVGKRQVTLKGPEGRVMTLAAGPEVRNLEQVKVGDRVTVGYLEALSLTLKKDGKEVPGTSLASDGARAAAGERPGGVVAEQVRIIADVIGVNAKTHMVTLRGPKEVVDLEVADPEQLKLIKVGDQIEAVYAQALAVSVEPATPPSKP